MKGEIRHGKLITILFFAIAVNTGIANYNHITNKAQDIANFIKGVEVKNPLRALKGGAIADPDNFSNF